MKNIRFSFGYLSQSKMDKITFELCNKFKFLPTFYIRLFSTYHNSSEYFRIKHHIDFDFLCYNFELRYIKKGSNDFYEWDFKTFKNS
jgi:hypothetical protein